ncbi:MAG: hypothetical protein JWO02_615 [Solirubrobacterales bacterium]|nr:hypothetical protein [Solirubrobacterales bacterium]
MRHSATPRHLPEAPTGLIQAFWVFVVLTLGLMVAVVIVARVDPFGAPVIGVAIAVLSVLWGLHVRAAHVHRAEIERDVAFRRARERRGF